MISTPAKDAITLHYQPLVNCAAEVTGLEALMRWHHQQRGPISPEAFIPVFENSGLILPLSSWALSQACADAADWERPLTVAVNLSPLQFKEQNLPQMVASVLERTGLAPGRLELELTEAALVADAAGARATLSQLGELGVMIALDDFGTGLSQPSHLWGYPFTKLKIDNSFIAAIEHSTAARGIIHSLIALGHSLDLSVAAEGVETEAQRSFLIDQGCDAMQGFFFGRPAAIEAFAALTGPSRSEHLQRHRVAPPTPLAVSRHYEEAAPMRGRA